MRRQLLIVLALGAALSACATPATTPPQRSDDPTAASQLVSLDATPSEAAEPTPSAAAVTPRWLALEATGPTAREDHTWTVDPDGGVAYLFGGRDGSTVFGDLWAYQLEGDSWSQLNVPAGPAPRFGHEAVWADGIGLVVFAGQAGTAFFNDLWAFDPAAGSWRQLPSSGAVPKARYGTCAGIGPDGRLWISHGFTEDQTRFADTVAYEFGTGAWADETPDAPVPVNRCLHGCWWTDTGELALFGGQTTGVTALGDLWLLEDGAWSMVDGSLPDDRNLYARARLPGATLIFGGQALDQTFLADAHLFTDGTDGATPLEIGGQGPAARAGGEMVVDARGRVLLFGGRDADRAYDDVWALEGLPPAG